MRTAAMTLVLAACVCAGCGDMQLGGPGAGYVKPAIAVMRFDSTASFPMGWKLGDGMKDILADRLVATKRFRVIERPDIAALARELKLQHSGMTRQHQRARPGRIKNVQYLIKGTITDFGHVSTAGGFVNWTRRLFAAGNTIKAVVSLMLQVVDVESGEIICSESLEESVRANDIEVRGTYKNVTFGGSVFWRKPLGRATASVVDRAVRRVTTSIAAQPWAPKVAAVHNGQVLINGGRNRRLHAGTEYEVLEAGEAIIDPDTDDVIGRHPGKRIGRVRIVEVHSRYSAAAILSGEARQFSPGQACHKAVPPAAVTRR